LDACKKNFELYKSTIEKIQNKKLNEVVSLELNNFLLAIKQWDKKFFYESIFFIDPPWGGYDYAKQSVINELYLDTVADDEDSNLDRTISLLSVIKRLLILGTCLIGLKLPLNFNIESYKNTILTWYPNNSIKCIDTIKYQGQYFFVIIKKHNAVPIK
jgi:hypothetical protein